MQLDKSRDYAITMGDSIARYHQDGKDFDANGEEITNMLAAVVIEPVEAPKRRGRPPKGAVE